MKSPITNKEMKLVQEEQTFTFRKEKFEIVSHYYLCEDSGERFTDTQLDELDINQVHNKYREKHNLPFPDEIKAIREKYGLTQNAISKILGLGINSYRQYESGEMPSLSNARLIQLAKEPANFLKMIETCELINEKLKNKYKKNVEKTVEDPDREMLLNYLLGSNNANIYTGYKSPDLEKVIQMVVFFAEKLTPYKTKMNKLLFYADFTNFKETGYSISGLRYIALQFGPVPNRFESIYDYINNNDYIEIEYKDYYSEKSGQIFKPIAERPFNKEIFTELELLTLDEIAEKFKNLNAEEISNISHQEEAWLKNEKNRSAISYEYAFEMD